MRTALVASAFLLIGVMVNDGAAIAGPSATDVSGQSVSAQRAPTRIVVRPTRRLVRACDFRLVREVRESGVYVVPRQRCWWTRR